MPTLSQKSICLINLGIIRPGFIGPSFIGKKFFLSFSRSLKTSPCRSEMCVKITFLGLIILEFYSFLPFFQSSSFSLIRNKWIQGYQNHSQMQTTLPKIIQNVLASTKQLRSVHKCSQNFTKCSIHFWILFWIECQTCNICQCLEWKQSEGRMSQCFSPFPPMMLKVPHGLGRNNRFSSSNTFCQFTRDVLSGDFCLSPLPQKLLKGHYNQNPFSFSVSWK